MQTASIADSIDFGNAAQWEAWLACNYKQTGGVWLRIAKKGSGSASITISDALDVALCYGWIDSQRKGYDGRYYLQRYSPRRPKSPWSKLNVARAKALISDGRMQPSGMVELDAAKADGRWDAAYEPQRNISIPLDLLEALAQNEPAKESFDLLDKTGQYAIVLPLLKAITSESRTTRLQKAIGRLEASEHV